MRRKPLDQCCNGDGRPVQPPSLVLCRECLAVPDRKFQDLAAHFDAKAKIAKDGSGS